MRKTIVITLVAVAVALVIAQAAIAAPVARFNWSPTVPQTGQAVTFDGRSSACDRAPCTYAWDDSGVLLGATPACQNTACSVLTTSFNYAGTKNARLTVRDRRGRTSSVTHTIEVVAPSPSGALWTADADTPGAWDVNAGDPGPEWASTTERVDHPWMVQRACLPAWPATAVRQGNCSYRFETRPGDWGAYSAEQAGSAVRSEMGMANPTRAGFEFGLEQEGSEVYYGFYIKRTAYTVGNGVQAGIQNKTIAPSGAPQFESYSTDRPDGLYVSFNNFREDTGAQVQVGMGMHPEPVGEQWYRYVIHLVHRTLPNGVIDVWFGPDDGQPLTKIVDKHDAHMYSFDGRPSHVRVGIYGSDIAATRVLYLDGFRAGTTYASVVPS